MRNHLPLFVLLAFLFFSFHATAAVTNTNHYIYFQTDSFNIAAQEQAQLSELISGLPTSGETEIWVTGHTDAEGNSQYNRNLSQQRAASVIKNMIALGLPADAIHQNYLGENKPVASNGSENGKAKNRRVEIVIKHTELNSMAEIISADASLAPQQFEISATTAQTIKGNKGMEITIPAGAFADANGKPVTAGKVNVTLTEYTDVATAFLHGVTSMSDKGLLQSGGMFNITASANGSPLQLATGKELGVKIPAVNPEPDMKVYISKPDTAGKLIWTETAAAFKPLTQPADTQKINLQRNKYDSFLTAVFSAPNAEAFSDIKAFTLKQPGMPIRPKLYLDKEKTLKDSGLRYISKNKKIQQKMLARINDNIAKNNARRQLNYEQKLAAYLADSAAYPQKLKEYQATRVEFAEYYMNVKMALDSFRNEYFQWVIKKRTQYYLKTVLAASENGKLYSTNLVQNLKNFCGSGNSIMRDYALERKIDEAYFKASLVRGAECRKVIFYRENLQIAMNTMDPELKGVMTALVDDNPYLSASEKQLQKAAISNGYVASSGMYYAKPVSYYDATIGQLGYVNCDRLREADNVVAMKVSLNQAAESVAFVKGINASQHIYDGNNKFKKDEELRLLSVYFENGRPQVAIKELKASADKVQLEYKEMKAEEFKQLVLSFI